MIPPSTLWSVDIMAVGDKNNECMLHRAAVEHSRRVITCGVAYQNEVEGVDMVVSDGTPLFDAAETGGARYGVRVSVADAMDAMRTAVELRCEGMLEELEDDMLEELEDFPVPTPANMADMTLNSR